MAAGVGIGVSDTFLAYLLGCPFPQRRSGGIVGWRYSYGLSSAHTVGLTTVRCGADRLGGDGANSTSWADGGASDSLGGGQSRINLENSRCVHWYHILPIPASNTSRSHDLPHKNPPNNPKSKEDYAKKSSARVDYASSRLFTSLSTGILSASSLSLETYAGHQPATAE